MKEAYLVRFYLPEAGVRIGIQMDNVIHDITESVHSISSLLINSVGRVQSFWDQLLDLSQSMKTMSIDDLNNFPHPDVPHWLAPVDHQDVWASGVTYERSREARQEEAVDGGDVYARVYSAKRPELFFKARGERVVGHLDNVGIRRDSAWNVPEPELALVINPAMEIVGLTIGNDMSSRSIEGENPLYLPQAKVYDASCALGPGILPWHDNKWPSVTITVEIERDQQAVFQDSIATERIHRSMEELVDYLGRSNKHPDGVILLTGTGVVPPLDFSLKADDKISITVTSIGTLTNIVQVV
jgi:2-dehydro-3-deoxy-D-arabinonate dehydratase